VLNNWRNFLWIRVQQFTSLEIQVSLFRHLHNLSLRWHLGRKTGEVLRVMDRGTNSINSLLQYLVFSILPTLVDIVVAIVYFGVALNIYFGLMVLVTMTIYLASTVLITEWRTKYRLVKGEASLVEVSRHRKDRPPDPAFGTCLIPC
jgi:ATP-binding cassette subfamily B (MDR/TAP) protein 6